MRIPDNRKLYLAHFSDGGIYSTGPQGDTPGGPIAYKLREMAQQAADAIDGEISMHCVDNLIEWCLKKHFVLWIRGVEGQMSYIKETVPRFPNTTAIRVEGTERERLIEVFHQQLGSQKRSIRGPKKRRNEGLLPAWL